MNSKTVVRNLKIMFYTVFIIQVMFFVSFAFKWINIASESASVSIVVERYALLITLIGIPGALKLFSMIMKKSKHPKDKDSYASLYKKAFIARFSILFIVASLNIILYAFSFNQNFMLCTLITFTAYIFSYPSLSFVEVKPKEANQEPVEEQDK